MVNLDDIYNQILTDGPSPSTLFHVLSELKKAGQLDRVIKESIKALNAYPKDIHIRKLLAETYFEAGLISQAEDEMEKVTTHLGDLISAYKLQAEIYRKQKRQGDAREALELYLAHRPDDQEALHFLDALKPGEEAPVAETQPRVEEVSGPIEEFIAEEPATAEGEELSVMATPTLGEIYFNQGQIQEAINTYERVVAQNPEDEHSRKRLEELKGMGLEEKVVGDKEADIVRQKKEKMISILESWLVNLQERFRTSPSVY